MVKTALICALFSAPLGGSGSQSNPV